MIEKVPPEIWLIIFQYLDKSLLHCLFVNKAFNAAAEKTTSFSVHFNCQNWSAFLINDRTARFYGDDALKIMSRPSWVTKCSVNVDSSSGLNALEQDCVCAVTRLTLWFQYPMTRITAEDLDRLCKALHRFHKLIALRIVDELAIQYVPGSYRALAAIAPMVRKLEYKGSCFSKPANYDAFAEISQYVTALIWRGEMLEDSELQRHLEICTNLVELTLILKAFPWRHDKPLVMPSTLKSLALGGSQNIEGTRIECTGCTKLSCTNRELALMKLHLPKLRDLYVKFYGTSGKIPEDEVAGIQRLVSSAGGLDRLFMEFTRCRDLTPLAEIMLRVREEVSMTGSFTHLPGSLDTVDAAKMLGDLAFTCQRVYCSLPLKQVKRVTRDVVDWVIGRWVQSSPHLMVISVRSLAGHNRDHFLESDMITIPASRFSNYRKTRNWSTKPVTTCQVDIAH
ncbi:hypothetical protein TRVA0_032S01068 [Trichomonascus vanleenenianus]|uniref:uncharacterized protein n=1 Tax=Trichomonascus vanleenenianus TaxID=2268995 RepID=UPI003ECAC733